MSPRIEADFSAISSNIGPLVAGPYVCKVKSIANSKVGTPEKDQIQFVLEVDDPQHAEANGREVYDNVVLQKNDGQPNKMAYGKIKQYAEAILGEEAANNPTGYDTDEFVGSQVLASITLESYDYIPKEHGTDESKRKKGQSNKVDRVVRVG